MEQILHVQHCDPYSVLIINKSGKLRRLYTPFKVQCIRETGTIKANTGIYIDEVAEDKNGCLVYIIGGYAHSYRDFIILAVF